MCEALNYEVNFLTKDQHLHSEGLCSAIKKEFDLIILFQNMNRLFGYDACEILDNYLALSLRKFLCDKESPILKLCPSFKMPPLSGEVCEYSGNGEMQVVTIDTYIQIKPKSEWIPLNEWLDETIAWIDKDANSIPDAYTDRFFSLLTSEISQKEFVNLFERDNRNGDVIWKVKNPQNNKQEVYNILKQKGYYDLTIKRLIKYTADRNGAHMDAKKSRWIQGVPSSHEINVSAISAFATQMIYAAVKQIEGLNDYYLVQPKIESLNT